MAPFGEYDSCNGSNVADINCAHPRIGNGRDEVSVLSDLRLKCQEA